MTLPNEVNPLLMGGSGGYRISNSLRFRSSASAYLSRTPASAGNRKTWTFSCWVKRGNLGTSYYMLGADAGSNTNMYLRFNADNTLQFFQQVSSVDTYYLITSQVFRDPSAWLHIIAVLDTTQATSTNRLKLYINGSQVTAFSATLYPSQNYDGTFNSNVSSFLGAWTATIQQFDGYLAEVNFIDGQALTPSSFGQNDATTGVWTPKAYTGTYGTNGFYLKFADNSGATATTIGKDSSGNGNNWTPNNISVTSGTTYDSMIDSPTNYADGGNGRGNYAVLNPLDKSPTETISLTDGNLKFAHTAYVASNSSGLRATIATNTGKFYIEFTCDKGSTQGNYVYGGWGDTTSSLSTSTTPTSSVSFNWDNNDLVSNVVSGSYSSGAAAYGDVIGFAIDLDAGKYWVARNNTWLNSGNPSAGTGNIGTFTTNPNWAPFVSTNVGGAGYTQYQGLVIANFGQRPFTYTPPSGFKALNTQNLPSPTIAAGNKYFDATTYSGTSASQTVTNSGSFQPDLVWIKSRSAATDHKLTDAVRGTTKALISDTTGAETTDTNGLTAFTSSGFTVGSDSNYNNGTGPATYIGWQWNAGGSTVSNTSGSITSSVRANPTAGFSVVTYTGNGTAGATVGHGLGVAPSMIIVKGRNTAGTYWIVYHQAVGNTTALGLNDTSAAYTASASYWNNTSPDSSKFTVGTGSGVNTNTTTYVAYCFAPVSGYSAFGSFTANNSTDGNFIYTNFKPRYIMIKRYSATGDWLILDTARNTYNVMNSFLYAELPDAEATASLIDSLSNGFKLRFATTGDFIYLAFASNPFKYSLAQ